MEKCKSLQQKSSQIRKQMSPSRGRLTLGINIYNIQKFSEFALPSVNRMCHEKKVPHVLGPKIWNIVPNYFKDFNTENSFQKAIKT